jgi:ABC-type uncharacterized transport system ATPase subunit
LSWRISATHHLRAAVPVFTLATMTSMAIEVRDLRRSYGEVEAVRGVSFEVARGEVFCLLGPNGAGQAASGAGSIWRWRWSATPS